MKNDLRVSMPEEIMLRMAQADTPDAARREGIKIAQEMLEAVRPMVQGVQVSAPFGRYNDRGRSDRQRAAAARIGACGYRRITGCWFNLLQPGRVIQWCEHNGNLYALI